MSTAYDLRYFYAERAVIEEQRHEEPRAAVVAELERGLLDLYRDPQVDTKPALLEQRGGAYYSEAAITGDEELARIALMTNPLVRAYALAGELIGQMRGR